MSSRTPVVETIDYHTAGEPFRIVPEPPVAISGEDVADRRARALTDPAVDGLRQLLVYEPRGHADMYGGFIVPADHDGADFGVLFWHKDGFSTACGHGTIALGAWAIESGRVPVDPSGITKVVVDVPSGRVTARVHADGARIRHIDFVNVASYRLATQVPVLTSRGPINVEIGFGGAIYAHAEASSLGLSVTPEQLDDLIAVGREIKWKLSDSPVARHPSDPRLSGIYGTIWFEDLGSDEDGALHQRNVTIFADGEVDRSPCGSGTCSRIAVLSAQGRMGPGTQLVHDSIVGSRFVGTIQKTLVTAEREAVIPMVTGNAHITGEHRFYVDAADDLVPGFVLR